MSMRHVAPCPVTMSILLVLLLTSSYVAAQTGPLVQPSNRKVLFDFRDAMGGKPESLFKTWVAANRCNTWTGINCDSFGFVTRIRLIDLGLRGKLPSSLGDLDKMQEIHVASHQIYGEIPSSLKKLQNMHTLKLQRNQLTGRIPEDLTDLTNLQSLSLEFNQLTGSLPRSLGNMYNLKFLSLHHNQLEGGLPQGISGCSSLESLDVNTNFLEGPVLEELGDLSYLQYLHLSINQFQGQIPFSLGNLPFLQHLLLDGNRLTGIIPTTFTKLTNLKVFRAINNRLTGVLPKFGQKPNAKMPALTDLILLGNELQGPLPDFGGLAGLQRLDLSRNQFNGTIPPSIGNLTEVLEVNIHTNQLTGAIPNTISKLTAVTFLDLHSNFLGSKLPAGIATLPNLRTLILNHNQFTGTFPGNFKSRSLLSINIDMNYFSGLPSVTSNGQTFCPGGQNLLILRNCFESSSTPDCPSTALQKPATLCQQFCNATAPEGPCGGNGFCFAPRFGAPQCVCAPGFNNIQNPKLCLRARRAYTGTKTLGLVPISSTPTKLSTKFRYASIGYSSILGTWSVAISLDWTRLGAVQRVKDQGNCNSCWAFAPVAAMESAYYITTGATAVPSISEQQIIDCQGSGSCQGGWPGDALEYAARMKLANSTMYPYKGKDKSRSCTPTQVVPGGNFGITQYETINFRGWFGLLLAVQQSPVIVNIEASQQSFVDYAAGQFRDDVYDDPFCFVEGVDHTVVIVGYSLLNIDRPYWLIRNSWGPGWGLSGYMKLQITGGFGVCGINSLPGLLPIVRGKDACNTGAWGRKDSRSFAGDVNPCGAGTCRSVKGINKCSNCPKPNWVVAANSDGSQTCVPASPCSFFAFNPCGVGTCVGATAGSYTCICPLGYGLGQLSLDNSPTCVTAALAQGLQKYIVPKGYLIKCSLVYQMYGIRKANFVRQNPKIDCTKPIPGGAVVNVTNTDLKNCTVPYAINKGDTCARIAKLFKLARIDGPTSPNPDLDCNNLQPGEQICVKRGEFLQVNLCTNVYAVQSGDSCQKIVDFNLGGNWTLFYLLNPGVYCGRLTPGQVNQNTDVPGQEVCLESTSLGRSGYQANCRRLKGVYFTVPSRPSCPQILREHYYRKRSMFRKFNNGAPCSERWLSNVVGSCLCGVVVPPLKRCGR